MPIKFRCNYCRQFLGISRAQAGGVVDCPTCGRSIRVPTIEGTVQPVSDPEINLEDAHLARALDELARLADEPVQQFVSLKSDRSGSNDSDAAETQIPQPILEPIPIEVPLPPTPVAVQPAVNATLATTTSNGVTTDRGLFAELAALSEQTHPGTSAQPAPVRSTRRARQVGVSTVAVVLVTFLAGMLTERFVRLLEGSRPSAPVEKKDTSPQVIDNELTGRITYKTKEGESQPDRGARVLVFPQTRTGDVKLSVVGFRPADSAADQQVANAALKALGGGGATVDASGGYRLPLEAGSYRLLVLSHFQPRDDSANDPALNKFLSEYFDKPEELLGRVQHQFAPLRAKGTADAWDYSFPAP